MNPERDDEIPECLACGACCHGDNGWVHLDADDDARVNADPVLAKLVTVTDRGPMRTHALAMIDGHCAALSLANGETRCTGYDARPSVCRELERGSAACRAARARMRG